MGQGHTNSRGHCILTQGAGRWVTGCLIQLEIHVKIRTPSSWPGVSLESLSLRCYSSLPAFHVATATRSSHRTHLCVLFLPLKVVAQGSVSLAVFSEHKGRFSLCPREESQGEGMWGDTNHSSRLLLPSSFQLLGMSQKNWKKIWHNLPLSLTAWDPSLAQSHGGGRREEKNGLNAFSTAMNTKQALNFH